MFTLQRVHSALGHAKESRNPREAGQELLGSHVINPGISDAVNVALRARGGRLSLSVCLGTVAFLT